MEIVVALQFAYRIDVELDINFTQALLVIYTEELQVLQVQGSDKAKVAAIKQKIVDLQ